MKLALSIMIGHGEMDRYLTIALPAALEFCDAVYALDDGTQDGATDYMTGLGVNVLRRDQPSFFAHEGRARQVLLEWTLAGDASHVICLDADEIVTDGKAVREACELDRGLGVWTLGITECWKADAGSLWLRADGAWDAQARAPLLYRAPRKAGGAWRIQDRALACGREPLAVRQLAGRAVRLAASVVHFGWTNESERAARYQRYVQHDGGRFHSRAHLDSIMFDDRRVRLARRDWPAGLEPYKAALLERANREPVTA